MNRNDELGVIEIYNAKAMNMARETFFVHLVHKDGEVVNKGDLVLYSDKQDRLIVDLRGERVYLPLISEIRII